MAKFYSINYYKITFTRLDKTTYSRYIKAFDEKDALKIVENNRLYERPNDLLEGKYIIERTSEEDYNLHH